MIIKIEQYALARGACIIVMTDYSTDMAMAMAMAVVAASSATETKTTAAAMEGGSREGSKNKEGIKGAISR